VDFLSARPQIDFSYSTNYLYKGEGDIWQRERWVSKSVPDWAPGVFLIRTMEGMSTLLQGMLIPKRCFEAVGPFDATLLRAQDHEMLIRLASRFRASNIMKPTFVLRSHNGPRGPNATTRGAREHAALQLRYQQQIFQKVREQYPLWSYVPHDPGVESPILTKNERGMALIQRSCIMLRQGLADIALSDLREGLDCLSRAEWQSREIGAILSKAVNIEPWIIPQQHHLISELTKTFRAKH
jgi:hypothetical protein